MAGHFVFCIMLCFVSNLTRKVLDRSLYLGPFCDVCVVARWTVMITNRCAPSMGLQDFLPSSGFQRDHWNLKSMI